MAVDTGGRERLLLAGERLMAERGPDAPLRDIAAAAGQRNNSAVHYHFGSREGLIVAIVERRQDAMDRARTAMLADLSTTGGGDDRLTALVEVLVAPMFTVPYEQGSTHYARFLDRVRMHPEVSTARNLDHWPATRMLVSKLYDSLTHLSGRERAERLSATSSALFALIADHESRAAVSPSGTPQPSQATITAMTVGMLGYPAISTPLGKGAASPDVVATTPELRFGIAEF
ncbi:TetR/AcrR family transcriptional regulator [Gordonia soli]|uniref:Putative TetR family transcriptional regulator n=1 Tax=Gordonia soli NBRC 108243 TaxID=1223545 RepID=M0QE42_9ACTN|nr:TetR/AcrR family transcriptional regulator [Gordonia soli]GAC66840.1 putative TetR family transcriptional regulator [Gordonia soli NBRC 108243]